MSIEDDVELRDLVTQTLESNGSLPKIRAQLRASVFLALEEDAKVSNKQPLLNNKLKTYQKNAQGKAMFCIVREFLDFFNLDFTISVYEPESYAGVEYRYEGRQKLANDLGISGLDYNSPGPLLLQMLNIAQKVRSKSTAENISVNGDVSSRKETITNGDISSEIKSVDEYNNHEGNTCNESKTESNDVLTNSCVVNNQINSNQNSSSQLENNTHPNVNLMSVKHDLQIDIPRVNLNDTFDVSSPTIEKSDSKVILKSKVNGEQKIMETNLSPDSPDGTSSKEQLQPDDTYEGTSSIAEDNDENIMLNSIEKSTENSENFQASPVTSSKSHNDHIKNSHDAINLMLKESKSKFDIDKPKLSPQKSEKTKSKNNLSSLSDLPPLPSGKSRVSDILPSLYKEFKEKPNFKDLDEMFDMQADYEEDFMSGSEMDLSLKSLSKTSLDKSGRSGNVTNLELSSKENDHCSRSNKQISNNVHSEERSKESNDASNTSSVISEHVGSNTNGSDIIE